ncbi:MAG: helix-turn-helix transcriptional regulator [Anaerolineales bacterium]
MDKRKIKELEAKGWKVGDIDEFLDLSEEEVAYIEMKVALSRKAREIRRKRKLTQVEVAERIGSSQSRVAKLEAGDKSVSLDLMIRSLLVLGASKEELAETIQG